MKEKLLLLSAMLVVLLTSACGAHVSPLQENAGEKLIYATSDEKRVFAEVYAAVTTRVPDSPVNDLAGPIRGYSVRDTFLTDFTDYLVRVYPAIGVTTAQDPVNGYYAEVTTNGTLMSSAANARKLYEDIGRRLSSFARPVYVVDIRPGDYIAERDSDRLNTAPSLREGGTIRVGGQISMADEIRRLDGLRQQGLITQTEFEQGKRRILGN